MPLLLLFNSTDMTPAPGKITLKSETILMSSLEGGFKYPTVDENYDFAADDYTVQLSSLSASSQRQFFYLQGAIF